MKGKLYSRGMTYVLDDGPEGPAPAGSDFPDYPSLSAFAADPHNLATLRRLLAAELGTATVRRLSTGDLLERFERKLDAGMLRLVRDASEHWLGMGTKGGGKKIAVGESSAAGAAGSSSGGSSSAGGSGPGGSQPQGRRTSSPPPPGQQAPGPAPDRPPVQQEESRIDAAAQAETLRQAAKQGVPFCEECEKAPGTGAAG